MMQIPSMSALRALEAVARLGSVWRAAEELNLTRSAVSHQLRFLEAQLGFPIVAKEGRGIVLTPQGEIYVRDVRKALGLLAAAQGRSAESELAGKLKISCAPGFGTFWLCGHIGDFRSAFPLVQMEIVTPSRYDDVSARGVDIFIAFGDGDWTDKWVELLVDLKFSPVCSPALLNASGGLNEPNDIAKLHLLHLADFGDWQRWLSAAHADEVDANQGIIFSDMHLLFSAALAGQGIAMGDAILARDALATGRLVRPFPTEIKSPRAYYLVADRNRRNRPPVAAFCEWIRARLGSVPV